MTDADIATIRQNLGPTNADLSRACSEALWAATTAGRRNARRRIARWMAKR